MNKLITINNDNVYLAQDLYNYDIGFFNGCSKIIKLFKKNRNHILFMPIYKKNGEIKLYLSKSQFIFERGINFRQ
jgi:hypothetical protein